MFFHYTSDANNSLFYQIHWPAEVIMLETIGKGIVTKNFQGVPNNIALAVGYTLIDKISGDDQGRHVPCPNNTREQMESELD